MSEFTKEQLEVLAANGWKRDDLAAFALTLMGQKEAEEAENDRLEGLLADVSAERDRLARELFEAEDAIREADRIMSEAETGEPRESIWRLIISAKAWRLIQLAVRRARERRK